MVLARVRIMTLVINIPAQNFSALCAAHDLALKKPKSFVLVGDEGLEPPALSV